MCCTIGKAELSETILYAGEAEHEGRVVHVMGYQNNSKNLEAGGNAMILPFPAAKEMGSKNVIEGCEHVLEDYAEAVKASAGGKGIRLSFDELPRSVQIFDTGQYTVVLAEEAKDIPNAIKLVPERKRPRINAEIFEAYGEWYKGWPIALCCFEGKEAVKNDPLYWWYEPKQTEWLFAPGLDGHDGNVPRLDIYVRREHAIIFGSTKRNGGEKVQFSEEIPANVEHFFAKNVVGKEISHTRQNCDFWGNIEKISKHKNPNDYKFVQAKPTDIGEIIK